MPQKLKDETTAAATPPLISTSRLATGQSTLRVAPNQLQNVGPYQDLAARLRRCKNRIRLEMQGLVSNERPLEGPLSQGWEESHGWSQLLVRLLMKRGESREIAADRAHAIWPVSKAIFGS